MYARVLVDTGATSQLDSLTYEIPDGLTERIDIGTCVLVPLGPRQAIGYVIGMEETSDVEKTRPIIADVDSPLHLSEDMLELARWISDQYMCSLPRVVGAMLPGALHCRLQGRVVPLDLAETQALFTPLENRLLQKIEAISGEPTLDSLYADEDKASIQRTLRQLETKGALRREWRLVAPSGKPRVLRGVRVSGEWSVRRGR